MMDFIMIPAVFGIIGFFTYKLFELYARRRERIMLIEKMTTKELPIDQITADSLSIGSNKYSALKWGCLFLGVGLGLLMGYFISLATLNSLNTNFNQYNQVLGVIYGSCVLLFGGAGLIASFIIEMTLSKNKK